MSGLIPKAKPQPTPVVTPAPPAPTRSNEEVTQMADAQRKKYASSLTQTNLTGGLGVSSSQTYGAAAQLLGQVGRS